MLQRVELMCGEGAPQISRGQKHRKCLTLILPAFKSLTVTATSRNPPWLPLSDAPGSCGGRFAIWSSMRETSGDTTTCR